MTGVKLSSRAVTVGVIAWSIAAALVVVSAGVAAEPPAISAEIGVSDDSDRPGERSPIAADPSVVTLDECLSSGSCWTVGSVLQLSVTLTLGEHTKTCARSCRLPLTSTFLVRSDDTYEIAGGFFLACTSGAVASLGSGTVTRRGRKIFLHPDDPGLLGELSSCLGGAPPHFTSVIRPSFDAMAVRGRTVAQGTAPAGAGTAHLAFRFRHKGLSVASGLTPVVGRHIKECPPLFVVRCELRVENP